MADEFGVTRVDDVFTEFIVRIVVPTEGRVAVIWIIHYPPHSPLVPAGCERATVLIVQQAGRHVRSKHFLVKVTGKLVREFNATFRIKV